MIKILPYDPIWPTAFARECLRLEGWFAVVDHVGSTSVPGLAAKAVIDIMAACDAVDPARDRALERLAAHGYGLVETGMRGRHLLHTPAGALGLAINLHLVPKAGWDRQPERLFCQALREHPRDRDAYAALKMDLALAHRGDLLGYTKAKTEFIQHVIDRVTTARGWPKIAVWED